MRGCGYCTVLATEEAVALCARGSKAINSPGVSDFIEIQERTTNILWVNHGNYSSESKGYVGRYLHVLQNLYFFRPHIFNC
jgi:hypothetical protein